MTLTFNEVLAVVDFTKTLLFMSYLGNRKSGKELSDDGKSLKHHCRRYREQ